MRKVVITGLGAITPLGNTVSEFWENLIAGHCGINEITRFDTTDFKVKIAAEVKGFNPSLYMDKADISRTDLFTQYAIGSASQAMEDSGLQDFDHDRFGVYIGSGIGGLATMVTETEKMLKNGPRRVSPFMIPMMISNMAAGQVAIRFNAPAYLLLPPAPPARTLSVKLSAPSPTVMLM
jgi:3-oxoacyl-[acyl-carrier-protein] synthase II